jgi:hypothetical protein
MGQFANGINHKKSCKFDKQSHNKKKLKVTGKNIA